MEIRVQQYFMAVARHENITKAAEELHLTQLTEAGLIFKARAQEILSLTEKTKEQFAKMDELVAMAYVAKVLAPLLSSHPVLSGQRQ